MGTGSAVAPAVQCGNWNLFLSSTDGDFEPYKQAVRAKLLTRAEVSCFHSSSWLPGFQDTVESCRERVEKCDGFILLLGYWYGSVPPGQSKSITHLEFDWAWQRWKDRSNPPMAVLTPKVPSEAHTQLAAAAKEILDEKDADSRARLQMQMELFRSEILTSWHRAQSFETSQALVDLSLVFCSFWRGFTAMAAAEGKVEPQRRAPSETRLREDVLGGLGRDSQVAAIRKVLVNMKAWSAAPGAALLIQGDEHSGQREFAAALPETFSKAGAWYGRGRPPDPFTADKLPQWLATTFRLDGASCDSPEALAGAIAPLLRGRSYNVVLDQVHRLDGGMAAFHAKFWTPLQARLAALRTAEDKGKLTLYLLDYRNRAASPGVAAPASTVTSPADLSKVLLLPELTPFTETDVTNWLEQCEVPDVPPNSHAAIAARVLSNANNLPDPVPDNVFKRLGDENLPIPEDSL